MIQVDGARLWADLMAMADVGATDGGGSHRLALSDADIGGRALFETWCQDAGYALTKDRLGTTYARREGRDPTLAPVVIGSHLDTQPFGGRFDGVLGVLAGLEALRTLDRDNIVTDRSLEVVNWTNEEGARFAPAMMASGVFAGALDLERVLAAQDRQGITVGEELARHGLDNGVDPAAKEMHAYLELHIEQGPILESAGETVGVVTGGQAIRWYDLTITGEETHAGPVPMALRNDPVRALGEVLALIHTAGTLDEAARSTVGVIETHPGSRNVVPGTVRLTVDLRHPDDARLAEMDGLLRDGIARLTAGPGTNRLAPTIALEQIWHSPVVAFDERLIDSVEAAAREHGHAHRRMISGAGHDAFYVARRVPTTMIFVPCRGGVSHNEAEYTAPEYATAGANVLLQAALAAAQA